MNYREAIQIQVRALQDIYDNCGALRDVADEDEKKYFNEMRGSIGRLWPFLRKLDNGLSDERATMELKGDYSIIVKEG